MRRSRALAGFVLAGLAASGSRAARAGANDINLLNLCTPGAQARNVPECTWVQRGAGGTITDVRPDDEAESRFRSLMSELGVVMAPRLLVPAETLGFAGFQFSAEVGTTTINHDQPFWNGVEGVSPQNPNGQRPDGWLTTVGMFVRKGLWLPLPAFEVGAGFMHLLDSHLVSWQGYAKFALHEGFYDWPLPSLAVRGSAAYLTGTDQVRMTVTSIDVVLSKGFGLFKTSRIEPFGGWSFLWIRARSNPFDLTPSCDAYLVRTATPGTTLGDYCGEAQRGTSNDYNANYAFPDQDAITRHRFFAGAKLKFSVVFISAQYELVPAGHTRDERRAIGARDGSGKQEGLSLSGGFDF
jgi:hypothetical protein